jgi:hypothetical protein
VSAYVNRRYDDSGYLSTPQFTPSVPLTGRRQETTLHSHGLREDSVEPTTGQAPQALGETPESGGDRAGQSFGMLAPVRVSDGETGRALARAYYGEWEVTYADVVRNSADLIEMACAPLEPVKARIAHLRALADLLDKARIGSGDLMAVVKQLIAPLSDP